MKTARGKDEITQQYIIKQNQFERVNEFTYLGTQINAQNKRSEEIRKRIQAGNSQIKTNLMQHCVVFISAESLYMFRAQAPIIRSI